MDSPIDELLASFHSVLSNALATHPKAELFAGLADRVANLGPARTVPASSNATVDTWLTPTVEVTSGPWVDLARKVLAATPESPWLRSYENLESSPQLDAFQQHYSFLLFAAPVYRGYEPPVLANDMLIGFTLQEPNVEYPAHHHGPAEIYGVISGHLEWQVGNTWTSVGPGDVIVHRSHESHAMYTGDEPVLTWVAWPTTEDGHVYMPSLDPDDMSMEPLVY